MNAGTWSGGLCAWAWLKPFLGWSRTANGLVATFDDNKVLFKRNGGAVLTGEKQKENLFNFT
ncbi:hypothetical protein OUZ56_025582 [Daphnia magna]|uniref:Uncharacterized protein n=1 Tax=Daphnia magna TaxID=35525 RepID=A0ABQ9ZKA5_9CRUS|nr:hypothetical protein OUZ56_025582 [Daphnia magna]